MSVTLVAASHQGQLSWPLLTLMYSSSCFRFFSFEPDLFGSQSHDQHNIYIYLDILEVYSILIQVRIYIAYAKAHMLCALPGGPIASSTSPSSSLFVA